MQTPDFSFSFASNRSAWIGLGLAAAYYILAAVALRARSRPLAVTAYEPPAGISPAVAAFLWNRGSCERSFAASIISLASGGFLKIRQQNDFVSFHRIPVDAGSLPAEESCTLKGVLPEGNSSCSFDSKGSSAIDQAFDAFRTVLAGEVTPRLISANRWVWLAGFAFLIAVLFRAFMSLAPGAPDVSFHSFALLYPLIWMVLGGSCFVAALHAWPGTARKLLSLIPGVRGRRRMLGASDALAVFLSAAAFLGFAFLAYYTSPDFAVIAAAALFIAVVSRPFLQSPTAPGRRALAQLKGFREFLARVEADKFDRENAPGRTPNILEKYMAYAVALDVERGWGEELAENLLEMLQFDRAMSSRRPATPSSHHEPFLRVYPPEGAVLELGISSRKVSD